MRQMGHLKGFNMPRMSFSVSKDAEKELTKLAEKTGKPIASLIREAIEIYLNQQGIKVNAKVQWGGYRPRETDSEESE
jgi:predicted transcriptional regulator